MRERSTIMYFCPRYLRGSIPEPYCRLSWVIMGESHGTGTGPAGLAGGAGLGGAAAGFGGLPAGVGWTAPDCFSAAGFCSPPGGDGVVDLLSSGILRSVHSPALQVVERTLTSNSWLLHSSTEPRHTQS